MNKKERKELKKLIDESIKETKEEISELQELTKPVSPDNAYGRLSRMDAINNKTINESALREKKSILQKLERAEVRAERDELGRCLKCGGEIPLGRLKIMPYTTRCVKCA